MSKKKELLDKIDSAIYNNKEYNEFRKFLDSNKRSYTTIKASEIPSKIRKNIDALSRHISSGKYIVDLIAVVRTPAFISYPGTGKTKSITNYLKQLVKEKVIEDFLAHDMMKYDSISSPFGVTLVLKKGAEENYESFAKETNKYQNVSSIINKMLDYFASDFDASILSASEYGMKTALSEIGSLVRDISVSDMISKLFDLLENQESDDLISKAFYSIFEIVRRLVFSAYTHALNDVLNASSSLKTFDVKSEFIDILSSKDTYYKTDALAMYITNSIVFHTYIFHDKINSKEIEAVSEFSKFREIFINHYVFAYAVMLNDLVLMFLSKSNSSDTFLLSLVSHVKRTLNRVGFSNFTYADVAYGILDVSEKSFARRKRYFSLTSKAIASVGNYISKEETFGKDIYSQNIVERLQDVLVALDTQENSYLMSLIRSKSDFVLGEKIEIVITNISEKTQRKGLRTFEEEFSKTFADSDSSDISLVSSIAEDFYNSAIAEISFRNVFLKAHDLVKKSIFRFGNILNFVTDIDLDIQMTYDVYFKGLKLGEKRVSELMPQNKLSFVFPDVVEDFIQKARSSYNRWLETKKGAPGIYVLFLDEFFHLFSGEAAGAVPALWDGLANRSDHFPPNMLLVLAGNSPRAAFFNALNSATSNSKISIDSMKAFFDRLDTYFVIPDVDFAYEAVSNQIVNDISFAHGQLSGKAQEIGEEMYKYIVEKLSRNYSYDYYSSFVKPRKEYSKKGKYSEFVLKNIVDFACNSSTRNLMLIDKLYKFDSLYRDGDEKSKQTILTALFAGVVNWFYEKTLSRTNEKSFNDFYKFLNNFVCSNYDLMNIIKFQSVWILSLANAYYKTIELFRLILSSMTAGDLDVTLDMIEIEKDASTASSYQTLMNIIDKKELSASSLTFIYLFLTIAAISFVSSLSECENCIRKLANAYNYIVQSVDFAGAGGIHYPRAMLMCGKLPENLGFRSKYEVRTEEMNIGKNRFSLIYYKEIVMALVKAENGESLLPEWFYTNYEDKDNVNYTTYQFIKSIYKYETGTTSESSIDLLFLVPESIPDKQKVDFIKAVNVVLYAIANRFNIFGENASFGFMEMMSKVVYPITSMSQRTLASNISETLNNVDLFMASVARIKYIEENFSKIAEELLNEVLSRYEVKQIDVLEELKNNLISFVQDVFASEKESIYGFAEIEKMVRWMNNQVTLTNYHFPYLMRLMLDSFANGQKGVYEYSHTEFIDNKAQFSMDESMIKSLSDKQALIHLISILPFYAGVSEAGSTSALIDFFENKIAPIYATIDLSKFVDALNRSGMDDEFLIKALKELGCSDESASFVIRDMSTVRGISAVSDIAKRIFIEFDEKDLEEMSREKIVSKAMEKYKDGNVAKAVKLANSDRKRDLVNAYNIFRKSLFELAGIKSNTKEVNYRCFLSIITDSLIAAYLMLYKVHQMASAGQYKYEHFFKKIPYMTKEMIMQNVLMLEGKVEDDLKKILHTVAIFTINEMNYVYRLKENKQVNIFEYELTNEVKTEIEQICLRILSKIKEEDEFKSFAENVINTEVVPYIYGLWNLEDKEEIINETSVDILKSIAQNANNQALVELNKSMIKLLIIFLAFAENVFNINQQKMDLVLSVSDIIASYLDNIRLQKMHVGVVSKNQDNPKAEYVLLKSKGGVVFYPNKFYYKKTDFYKRLVMYKDCAPMNDKPRAEAEMDYAYEEAPGNMININVFKTKSYKNHYAIPYLVDQGDVAVTWLAHNYIANPLLRGKKEALIATLISMLAFIAGDYDIDRIVSTFSPMEAMSTQDKLSYLVNLLKERKHVHMYLAIFAFETESVSEFGKQIAEYIANNKESGYTDFDEVNSYISSVITKSEETRHMAPQEFFEFATFSDVVLEKTKKINVCKKAYRGKLVSPIEIIFV